jgi:2-hydroxychromene-2-carboxylate isomerase
MFPRFRETGRRLQVSLVETHRVDGRIRNSHVAGLGSVGVPASPADRWEYWTKLISRMEALANRVTGDTKAAILTAVDARIPMLTPEEQQAVQVDYAKEDVRQWEMVHGLNADRLNGHKKVAAKVARDIAAAEAGAEIGACVVKAAQARLTRAAAGEVVAVTKLTTAEALLKATGITPTEMRHMRTLAKLDEAALPKIVEAGMRGAKRAEHAAARAILAQQSRS